MQDLRDHRVGAAIAAVSERPERVSGDL